MYFSLFISFILFPYQEEIASILVRHECDVDMADSSSGLTALHKVI